MSVHCTCSTDVTRSVVVYAVLYCIYFKLDLTEENRIFTLAFLLHAVLLSSFLAPVKEMCTGFVRRIGQGQMDQMDDSNRPGLLQLIPSTRRVTLSMHCHTMSWYFCSYIANIVDTRRIFELHYQSSAIFLTKFSSQHFMPNFWKWFQPQKVKKKVKYSNLFNRKTESCYTMLLFPSQVFS